jgi:hypothetical protein
MMLRIFMGIAGLSTAQDDILEALGIAHQVHVCGFSDSEIERVSASGRRKPIELIVGPAIFDRASRPSMKPSSFKPL